MALTQTRPPKTRYERRDLETIPQHSPSPKVAHKRNGQIRGSVTSRNNSEPDLPKNSQWSTPGGWYFKTSKKLPGKEPMAVYFVGSVAVAWQYLLPEKTRGVAVLK